VKILSIVGARPQFVKAAPLLREFARRTCEHVLVHTGQHYDYEMSQVFFDQLQIAPPDYSLGVGSDSHAAQTAEMMRRLEPALAAQQPDWVLVFGDTNSTLAGALTAAKMKLRIGHVEAGLRSFNRAMPEEINRIVADHVAGLLFAPNPGAARQLAAEGIRSGVHLVGDLMLDLALETSAMLPPRPDIARRLGVAGKEYAVATVHRASNTDDADAFGRIAAGLRRIGMPVVFPVHPRAASLARRFLPAGASDPVVVVEPMPYQDMIALVRGARVVLTDSGGLQKEAVVLGVPCVTLRDETEWPETLESGWNALAGTDPERIAALAARPAPKRPSAFFGSDGGCARRIADVLLDGSAQSREPAREVLAGLSG